MAFDYFSKSKIQYILTKLKVIFDTKANIGDVVTGVKGDSESSYRKGKVNVTKSNIGLGNVGNFKAVSTAASQGLTDTEKSNARTNIGAGTGDGTVTAVKVNGTSNTPTDGVVDIGTVITSHQDISGKADKSSTVSTVSWDSNNKKITKTINGSTTDVVTASTILDNLTASQVNTALGYIPSDFAIEMDKAVIGWSGKNINKDVQTYKFDKSGATGTRIKSFRLSKLLKTGDKLKVSFSLSNISYDTHNPNDVLFARIGSSESYSGSAFYWDVSTTERQIHEFTVTSDPPSLDACTLYMGLKNISNWNGVMTVNELMVYDAAIVDDTYETYHPSADKFFAPTSLIKNTVGWTGKNLYNNTASNFTKNGSTVTINSDKSVTITTRPNMNTRFDLSKIYLKAGVRYKLTGCPSGGSSSTYWLGLYDYTTVVYSDYGSGIELQPSSDVFYTVAIRIGTTVTLPLTFYPMVSLADNVDSTYEPYHPSVEESKCDTSVVAPLENESTVQKSSGYAIGEHFIRNGAFCTATAAKSRGDSLSSGFISEDLASLLTVKSITLTPMSGIDITYNNSKAFGKVVCINFVMFINDSVTLNNYMELITVQSGYQPSQAIQGHFVALNNLSLVVTQLTLDIAGIISYANKIDNSIIKNHSYAVSFIYIIP